MPSPATEGRWTILHVSTRLILGGSQENTVLSCEGQARRGHAVHLAFGPIFGPEGSLYDRVQQFNARAAQGLELTRAGRPVTPIACHELPDLIREVSPARDLRAYGQLRRLIAQIGPSLVHTHSSKAGILGRLAAWHTRPRPGVVHTIHGPPFLPAVGPFIPRLKIRVSNTLYALAERVAARRCHVMVSVADAMTHLYARERIGAHTQFLTVRSGMETAPYLTIAPLDPSHPHGIAPATPAGTGHDLRTQTRHQLGLHPADLVFVTIARLSENKGHHDLITALAPALRAHPRWKLLWVGDGWLRPQLEQRLAAEGLTDRAILTGLVPPDRIPAMLAASDALIHPSEREGLPRTVVQALLAERPVIATDVDGTREACIHESTGLLVPMNATDELRDAVLWMASHPAERAAMARRGRQLARVDFDTERMIDGLEIAYARAIDAAA